MDLTETGDMRKRRQEYTEELHKNDLHNPDNRDGMITHVKPDTLECKVKWALVKEETERIGSILKAGLHLGPDCGL